MFDFCCTHCMVSFFFLLVFCAIVLLHSADLFWVKSKIRYLLESMVNKD